MRRITVVAVAAREPASSVGMESAAVVAVGDQIDRFVLEEELGSGGMARVFKARHVLLQTEHALKILSPELVANESIRQRFLGEAQIQALLAHPNVVRVRDILALPGVAALVMDFIPARPLSELICSWSTPPDSNVIHSIFLQLLEGIGAAHRLGIVHRDIKPSNVLIEDLGGRYIVHIIDFGIAKWAGGTAKHATATGVRMGTPAYMSPEQIRGAKEVTARSDIFSLGVTLYELTTLHTPFQGDSDFDVQTAVVHGDYLAPMKRVSNIDPLLAEGIRRALAPDPDLRFASCAEFAAAIRPPAVNAPRSREAPHGGGALPSPPFVARHTEPQPTPPGRPSPASTDRRTRTSSSKAEKVFHRAAANEVMGRLTAPPSSPRKLSESDYVPIIAFVVAVFVVVIVSHNTVGGVAKETVPQGTDEGAPKRTRVDVIGLPEATKPPGQAAPSPATPGSRVNADLHQHSQRQAREEVLAWSSPSPRPMTWEQAKTYCPKLARGGPVLSTTNREHWRLPTKDELLALHSGRGAAVIVGDTNWYWSSSAYSDGYVWSVHFADGGTSADDIVNKSKVRCILTSEAESGFELVPE